MFDVLHSDSLGGAAVIITREIDQSCGEGGGVWSTCMSAKPTIYPQVPVRVLVPDHTLWQEIPSTWPQQRVM